MSDIMHIGMSALAAYQTTMQVASQNIANADVPYYSRREVLLTESPIFSGVNVAAVRRIYDETANRYAQASNSDFSQWNISFQQFSGFEQLFDDNNTSVGKFINESYSALQQISDNFTTSSRTLYMNRLSALSGQFQNVSGQINKQLININQSLQGDVNQANHILDGIANINKILLHSNVTEHSDLLDQREALVQDLSRYLDFNVQTDQNGIIDISLNNGFPILNGKDRYNFTTMTDPANTANLMIAISNGATTIPITPAIHSGEMRGLIQYRETGLIPAQAALGRLALVMAQKLNSQNKLGIDANGNLGGNIFADINTSSMMVNRVNPNTANTGSGSLSVSIDDVTKLNTSNYKLSIGASNTYTLTRLSDNTIVNSGTLSSFPQKISVDGFSLNVASGTFNSGDQYMISPTQGASDNISLLATDPSQLALGWPVNATQGTKQPTSNGSITVNSINDITNSSFSTAKQLNPPIEIRFSVSGGVTTYSLYNATTSALIEGGLAYTEGKGIFPTAGGYDPGYQVSISGNSIQDGDSFNINYNNHPEVDNRNAKATAAIYQQGSVLGANNQLISFSQGYTFLSSDISGKTNEAKARLETATNVKNQAEKNREGISGVSLVDETMNLSQYQVAYQASAQVLQTAHSIFDTIISLTRR